MFDKAEKDSIGSIPQIIGGLYSNCCKLNQNKENNSNIQNCLQNLQKTRSII